MQCIQSMLSENCLKMAVKPWDGPPRSPGGPRDATLSPAYLGTSPQLEPTTTLFIHNFTILTQFYTFTKLGIMLLSHPAISQRSSTSDFLTCTSIATSIGDPSSHGVGHLREWPSAMALESDRRSSYASLSSSPMTASQSHKHRCLFGSCSSS